MRGKGQVPGRIARDIALEQHAVEVPSLEMAAEGRGAVKRGDVIEKGPLAQDGHEEPEFRRPIQSRVRTCETRLFDRHASCRHACPIAPSYPCSPWWGWERGGMTAGVKKLTA